MSNKTVAYIRCSCEHEMQDQMYGKQVRVANLVTKANPPAGYREVRCTVCSRQHRVSEGRMH